MHDLKYIRENKNDFVRRLKRRGFEVNIDEIIDIDIENRKLINELQIINTEKNNLSKTIGLLKSRKEDASGFIAQVSILKEKIPELEKALESCKVLLSEKLLNIPNLPDTSLPLGTKAKDNQEIYNSNNKKKINYKAKEHFELGLFLGLMDFDKAGDISGSRFVILKNDLAKLERALSNFMLDMHINEHGYEEVSPSHLVRGESLLGTGQLPKFKDDLFVVDTDKWLIPTGEVPLTNMVRNEVLTSDKLPLRFTASTSCFRSEAGAAGKDTRGMIRLHEFKKVELVSITRPEDSAKELDRLTECAKNILVKLKLPYRVMLLCGGDTGFSANKTYDLEVWLPGQKQYREISSCSNCTDFQARRMNARFKDRLTGEIGYLHTLNGSGLAVGRTLLAIIENYQDEDGSILIPEVLREYMGGQKKISKDIN